MEHEIESEGNGVSDDAAEASGQGEARTEPDTVDAAAERDRLKDQLLRTAADFDNYRKRSQREVEDARRRGREDALREILPVMDNLERAVAAADSATDVGSVIDGVRMVLKLFEDVGGRLGLERIPSIGQRFDPAVHDAVQQLETDDQPAGTIVAEVVPGYKLGDRLLRAAMVVVARPRSVVDTSQKS